MRYYPIYLDIKDRPCLVAGGGAVGLRKVAALLECGARVTVVDPAAHAKLLDLAAEGAIELRNRPYQSADMNGMFLIIGATDDEALNLKIKTDADQKGVLCNIADRPEACHFILPAVVRRGDLTIAVSTSGKSPAFAKKIRKDLEAMFGPEYADFLKLMGAIRRKLLGRRDAPEDHRHLFEQLIDKGLVHMIKERNRTAIDTLLYETFGKGYTFDALMDDEPGEP
ncbi:MAG: bifunctional precorrin-2 dehydrogenase/sirohydrochlorin ferrochelatase [Thermodesulfobacteriota bacterium]